MFEQLIPCLQYHGPCITNYHMDPWGISVRKVKVLALETWNVFYLLYAIFVSYLTKKFIQHLPKNSNFKHFDSEENHDESPNPNQIPYEFIYF